MEDIQTVSTDSQEQDPNSSVKTRLANLLINRVALSECLNVIRDACVERAGQIIDNATEEDMAKILKDVELFENPPEPEEGVSQSASGPAQEASGPVGSSDITPVEVLQSTSGPV